MIMHIAYVVTYGLLHHTCDIRLKNIVTMIEEVEAQTGSLSCHGHIVNCW